MKYKNGRLYTDLVWCYEFITTGEEHKKEADFIVQIVNQYKKSSGNDLLNVASGHGWHDKFLKKNYTITGIDYNKDIMKLAKKKNPEISYKQGDMKNFKLNKKFDIVMSFDSMNHNLSCKNLKSTIKCLVSHVKDDGVLIFHLDKLKENFKNGYGNIGSEEHYKDNTYVVFSQLDYDKDPTDTVFEMCLVFLIARKGEDIEVKIDKLDMGCFELSKIKSILSEFGLKTYLYSGNFSGKKYSKKSPFPVFVCVKS